jgi:hypothetical protein
MHTNTPKNRLICRTCNRKLQRYGRTTAGTVRFRCRTCGITQISHQKRKPSKRPYFHLFREYVLDGVTYQYLAKKNRVAQKTLALWFHSYLAQEPPWLPLPPLDREHLYLLIDGKWQGKQAVTMLYRRSDTKTILHTSVMKKEYASLIKKDLIYLVSQGFVCSGVISDGGTGITKAVAEVFPYLPHQRCLAHVHRQYTAALGKQPKEPCVQELKKLVDHLFLIESRAALKDWLSWVKHWQHVNWQYLHERRRDDLGRVWFAHPAARKVCFGLFKTTKTSFVFLRQPLMPKTTNCLEASIGVMADKKRIHRGLKRKRQPQFINWYIYFYNQRLMSSRK